MRTTHPDADASAREARIRERAYHLWQAAGRPDGQAEVFWHRACEEVAAEESAAPETTRAKPKRVRRVPEAAAPSGRKPAARRKPTAGGTPE